MARKPAPRPESVPVIGLLECVVCVCVCVCVVCAVGDVSRGRHRWDVGLSREDTESPQTYLQSQEWVSEAETSRKRRWPAPWLWVGGGGCRGAGADVRKLALG